MLGMLAWHGMDSLPGFLAAVYYTCIVYSQPCHYSDTTTDVIYSLDIYAQSHTYTHAHTHTHTHTHTHKENSSFQHP